MSKFSLAKQKLLSSALLNVPLLLFPTAAFADCLPNASGTIVACNANDPDGFLAGDAVTINVNPAATVDGPLTVGIAGRVNNEGIIGNTGASTVTTGGNSTFSNTRVATINGAVVMGTTTAGQVNTIDNRGAFNATIVSNGALNLTNTFSGIDVGVINGAINSTGVTNISNVGASSVINGAITLGAGNDVISNDGTITGAINFGGGTTTLTNVAGGSIMGNIAASGDTAITNAGSITGNITLGAGNDTITTTGTITGNIDLGAGTNTIGFGSSGALPTGTLTADAAGLNTINLFGSGADTLGISVTNFDVLNKDGTGSWALSQPVLLADRININAGTLITNDADWLAGNHIINNATLNFANVADGTYSGVLEGGGAVTVGGGGAAITTFSGANIYTGATTVTQGTLRLTGGAAILDTGNVTVTAPGILDIAAAETLGGLLGTGSVTLSGGGLTVGNGNFTGVISGVNGLTKTTAGTLTLGGANTYTGVTTVTNGTLVLAGGAAIADTGAVIVNAAAGPPATSGTLSVSAAETIGSLAGNGGSVVLGAALTTGDATSTSYAGIISGTGSLIKQGTGVFTLTGANTYSGGTTVNAGTLAGAAGPLEGTILVNAAGTVRFDQPVDGNFTGALSGPGTVNKEGGGVLTLSGNNSAHSGALNVNAGIVSIAGTTNIGTGTVTLVGTTLRTTGAATLGNAFTLTGSGIFDAQAATTLSGVISGGALTKIGGGTLTLSGANTYTGVTTINAGVLEVTGGAAIVDTNAVVVNAPGGFTVSAAETIGSVNGNGALVLNGATLTTGGANTADTYAGIISGAGGLVKQGTGVFTLTGANTYSGGATVNAGTLAGAAGPLQGVILVNAAGTVRFDQTGAGNFSGALSGPGIVNKEGAGVLTLSGNNSAHSGAFNINGGTVAIGAATNIGTGTISLTGTTLQTTGALSLANAITLNAPGGTLLTGADTVLSGVISGAGALTKTGSANLTLSGANTYTGGTTVSLGTLTGTTTSLQGNIVNNAAVVFNQAAGGNYAGNLSGTGTVSTAGAGPVTLSGANTYSGATNVNVGTLIAGGTGIGDASAVTVAAGATLQLAGNETVGSLAGAGALDTAAFTLTSGGNNGSTTFAGATTGTGLTKVGTGTMTLTGTGTLSGALTAGGGGLTIGTGGNYTAGSAAANAGTLTVAGTLTAPTTVASAATLDVLTGGALVGSVTGAAGSTTRVNGVVTGSVDNAGTLGGAGTINGTLTNSGNLRPGNSPGIITVNGAFVQTATGTLNAELTPVAVAGTGYDQVRVTGVPGTATLAGTLALAPSTGLYTAGSLYNVVLADGGISGAFSAVTGNVISPFLSFTNTGIVTVLGAQQAYRLTVTRTNYAAGLGATATPNQIATANGFQAIVAGATGDAAALVTSVDNLTAAQAQSYFDQVSPESYGAYATALQDQGELFTRQVALRSAGVDTSTSRTGVWGRAYGQSGKGHNRSFRFGSDQDIYGGALGVDFKKGDLTIGGAVGYSKSNVDYGLGNASGDSKSWQAGVYGNYDWGKLGAGLQVAYIDGRFTSTKSVVAGTVNRVAAAKFNGNLIKVVGNIGYNAGNENTVIRPFVAIDYTSGSVKGFTETGAGAANLTVAKIDADDTDLLVGIRLETKAGAITPYGRLAYRYQIGNQNRNITGLFNGNAGSAFTVSGIEPSKSQFDVDAGLSVAVGKGGAVFAGYQGSYRSDLTRHGGSVGFRFGF